MPQEALSAIQSMKDTRNRSYHHQDGSNTLTPLSVSVQEATRLLGFNDTKSTYRLIHQGEVKARKSGRIFLVSYASLKAYIEA